MPYLVCSMGLLSFQTLKLMFCIICHMLRALGSLFSFFLLITRNNVIIFSSLLLFPSSLSVVFPCRLCSRNACYVITLLQPSFVAGFAQEMFVTLLRYYRVFPCRLCSRNACYVITLLRGLSLPALLKKCLLRYY